jgi:hypothetical protein
MFKFKNVYVSVICISNIRACFACLPVGRNFVLRKSILQILEILRLKLRISPTAPSRDVRIKIMVCLFCYFIEAVFQEKPLLF